MPNVWAEELRVFLRANERAIATGEMALQTTFRHVMGKQAAVPGVPAVENLGAAVTSDSPPVT